MIASLHSCQDAPSTVSTARLPPGQQPVLDQCRGFTTCYPTQVVLTPRRLYRFTSQTGIGLPDAALELMRDKPQSTGSEEEALMDLRKITRIRVHFRSFFSSSQIEGEGTVTDLSTKGCKIVSDRLVQPNTALEVWFFLPDRDQPLKVQLAEVRWTKGRDFGLEFLTMRSQDQERIGRVLQDQEIGSRA